jgi:general secretion pathway protein G
LLTCIPVYCEQTETDPSCANIDAQLADMRGRAAGPVVECPADAEGVMGALAEAECTEPFVLGFIEGYLRRTLAQDAEANVAQLRGFVDVFRLLHNRHPTTLDELTQEVDGLGAVTLEMRSDPWGHPFGYTSGIDGTFTVFSAGPDGQSGTDDDIYPEGMEPAPSP